MKTVFTLRITPQSGDSFNEEIEIEKEKFEAIRELNEEHLPLLKFKHKEVLVIKVK